MKALLHFIVWVSLVAITTITRGQVPENLQKDLQEADKYYYGGQFAKAISLYNTVFIRINPKNHQEIAEIMKKLGDCYSKQGLVKFNLKHYEEAIIDLEKAVEMRVNDANVFYSIGVSKYYLKKYEEAILPLDKAIKLNPNEAKYIAFRGLIKLQELQFKDAIIDLEKAVEMGVTGAPIFSAIGVSKYNLKKYEEAILELDKAINLNPNNKEYFKYRGNAKYYLNQYKEAFADYEKAIALGGSKGEFYDEVVKKLKESTAVAPIVTKKRFALVIANSKYKNLKNLEKQPQEDAKTIMPKLKACGFEVMVYYDITTKTEMQKAIIDFSIKAKNAEIVLVYYGGHGLEFSGKNYLLPTDISLTKQEYTKAEAVALEDDLLLGISECHAALNLVVLDACRVNPFEDTNTNRGDDYRGMRATPSSYTDIVVFYATSQGRVAKNDGRFAKSFAENLNKGVTLSDFMIDVTNNVKSSSEGSQLPYQAGSISKKFQF